MHCFLGAFKVKQKSTPSFIPILHKSIVYIYQFCYNCLTMCIALVLEIILWQSNLEYVSKQPSY